MKGQGKLLTRDAFREGVFARDRWKCVVCKQAAQDAHHILERRLFVDGGYYLENGASLCGACHLRAEETTLSCEEIRSAAGIASVVLPDHLYPDERYDKWGDPFLAGGRRARGELFEDESVQKILKPVLAQFTDYVKYPRTWHLPWSPGAGQDDRILRSITCFAGRKVVVTTKMDGENTTLYTDHVHARSVDSGSDPTRHWVQNLHARIGWQIPKGYRLCGENLYAKHSISYSNLESYFHLFSVWNGNTCLSWQETLEWAGLLELKGVEVLYEGPFDEKLIRGLYDPARDGATREGYVVRRADAFRYAEFSQAVGKYVRAGHVVAGHGWRRARIEPNGL